MIEKVGKCFVLVVVLVGHNFAPTDQPISVAENSYVLP